MRKIFNGKGIIADIKELKDTEIDKLNSLYSKNSNIPNILLGRYNEFSGIMQGWVPDNNDSVFRLEDNYLDHNGIIIADKFSKIISNKDPFYEFVFAPKGPSGLLPWIFTFILEYAITKGLDYVIEKLKDKDPKDLAKEISIKWGSNNGDSLGQIEVTFSDGRCFTIENYPHSIDRITLKQLEAAKVILKKESNTHVIYDAWGRISVYINDEYGNKLDIKL